MAERRTVRPGYGWETPFDLYVAIQRQLGFGELTYHRDTQQGLHVFRWETAVDGSTYVAVARFSQADLIRPVAQLAVRTVETWKHNLRASAARLKGDPCHTSPK